MDTIDTFLPEAPVAPAADHATAWVGLDVGKDTLDACLLTTPSKPYHKSFANAPDGHEKLLRWVQQRVSDQDGRICHFALEATGAYGQAIANFLAHAQQRVSVVNPTRVKYSGIAVGRGNKTDKADALTIAQYCRLHSPPLWREATLEMQNLRALARRLVDVQGLLAQEKNRSQVPGLLPTIRQSLERSLCFLKEESQQLRRQIADIIEYSASLKAELELLMSIPGIGEITAQTVLAELPDVAQFGSAEQVAAWAGLCPREYLSHASVTVFWYQCSQAQPPFQGGERSPAQSSVLSRHHGDPVQPVCDRAVRASAGGRQVADVGTGGGDAQAANVVLWRSQESSEVYARLDETAASCPRRPLTTYYLVDAPQKTAAAKHLVMMQKCSQRQACRFVSLCRSTARYTPRPSTDEAELVERLTEFAQKRRRRGYRLAHQELRRGGGLFASVNHKRVYRLWRREGLSVSLRRTRKRVRSVSAPREVVADRPNSVWSHGVCPWCLDFLQDNTLGGAKLRILSVSDEFTRESLALEVGRSFKSERVCQEVEALIAKRGVPAALRMDNGPEFVALALRGLCYRHGINPAYIEPGKPWHTQRCCGGAKWVCREFSRTVA